MPYISPLSLSPKRGNMSPVVTTEELHDNEASTFLFPFLSIDLHLATFAFAYTISFLSNIRAIHVTYRRFSKKIQSSFSANVLVAHLSLICIGITKLSMLNTFQSYDLLPAFGPLFRHISVFLEDSLICGFSLNIVLLVDELIFKATIFLKRPKVFQLLGILWSMAITQAFFTIGFIFITISKLNKFKLLAQIAGICCEIVRYLVFCLSTGCFIGFALFESRKLDQLPRRMGNINIFRIHFSMFIIIWICYGLWNITNRFAFFLDFDLNQYSTLMDCIKLGFYSYLTLNPMIYTFFLGFEVASFPGTDLCSNVTSKSHENFEKETGKESKYGDLHSVVDRTYSTVTKEEKIAPPTVFYVTADVLNSFPANDEQKSRNQMHMQNVQFLRNKMDEENIRKRGDASSTEKQCKIFEKHTKVSFSDIVQIKYYEKDSLDESNSNKEHTRTSGEIVDDQVMKTVL